MPAFTSPVEALLYWEENAPKSIFLKQPFDGKLKTYTYRQSAEEIRKIAAGLKSLGIPDGSSIALLSKNCAHWMMADIAIMMAGYVSVPIYPTLNASSIEYILQHSESKAIIVGKLDNYESQKAGINNIHTIGIEKYGIQEDLTWEKLVEENEPMQDIPKMDEDELCSIIYTSGTTGNPKGVMHSVGNFSRASNAAVEIISLPEEPRFFSYLPLSHVAERVAIEIHGLFRCASFHFPESLETFAADLESCQPHLFFAVPRIWIKFREKVFEKMPRKKLRALFSIPFLGGFFKRKLVEKMGLAHVKYAVSGAAPLNMDVLKWYKRLGVIIHQDYGMTEDCIYSHYNLQGKNRFGSVGKPLPGVEAKLTSEGEIKIKNDNLMLGYYKDPEGTARAFDEDGFLKTGDIGEFDHEGFLYITGRIKDQFKTDKGKFVSPAPIELELLKNTDLDQVCVVGMGIPHPIALVILSEQGKKKSQTELTTCIHETIEELNSRLEKHEKLNKAVVMKEDWTIDNGLLTPTLKVKRNQVEKIHMPMYNDWFHEKGEVIWEN